MYRALGAGTDRQRQLDQPPLAIRKRTGIGGGLAERGISAPDLGMVLGQIAGRSGHRFAHAGLLCPVAIMPWCLRPPPA